MTALEPENCSVSTGHWNEFGKCIHCGVREEDTRSCDQRPQAGRSEIARLTAALAEAQANSANALEQRLWAVIDRGGLGNVPSDIVGAVVALVAAESRLSAQEAENRQLREALQAFVDMEHCEAHIEDSFERLLPIGKSALAAFPLTTALSERERAERKVVEAAISWDCAEDDDVVHDKELELRFAVKALNSLTAPDGEETT